ncbi:MAG: zinc ribbon domain-containing protein [Candidatus Aminicenantes bacterium]|nr:zinc ribbon domain-containing protein [Candidatus Aminicenantes bacterium]
MPLYEYKCSQCDKKIEIIQKIGDKSPIKCPFCGGKLKKLISIPAIQFKGSGWYVTDYAGSKANHSPSLSPEAKKKAESAKNNNGTKTKKSDQVKN